MLKWHKVFETEEARALTHQSVIEIRSHAYFTSGRHFEIMTKTVENFFPAADVSGLCQSSVSTAIEYVRLVLESTGSTAVMSMD